MGGGLVALIFVILIVVIIFLVFQVYENSNRCKETRVSQQDRMTKAARLMVQSATQNHPLFAFTHALEAKITIDEVINSHGGIILAERNLKLPKGRLEKLRHQIYQQYTDIETDVMEKVIERYPDLDVPENEDAGLRKKKRRRSAHRSRRHKE
jgi:hypothetical protein